TCCGYGYDLARNSNSFPRIFMDQIKRTRHHRNRGALRKQRPYLRLNRFQGDRLTHIQLLFTWNPSPLQSSRISLEYLLLPPRSAPMEAPTGPTPKVFNANHCDPLTRCGQRHPFSGLVDLAAVSNFHGHRPAVYINQRLSWGLMSGKFGTLTQRLVHPTAPVLLTKNGPLGVHIQCLCFIHLFKQARRHTH
ncbi:hypothetical protein DINM_003097, partial [Dirofilaria immitis]|nr:hypothetical protein [Dirofilaria immitis]